MVANAIANAINRPRSDSQNMQRDGRGHPTDQPNDHRHPSFNPFSFLQSLESRTSILDFPDYVAMQYLWRDPSVNICYSLEHQSVSLSLLLGGIRKETAPDSTQVDREHPVLGTG